MCLYAEPVSDLGTMSGLKEKLVLLYACKHLCHQVCLKWRVYMPLGASFFLGGDVPLVELMYLVFTRMPGVGDSGLCCCVPCLLSASISLCMRVTMIIEQWGESRDTRH